MNQPTEDTPARPPTVKVNVHPVPALKGHPPKLRSQQGWAILAVGLGTGWLTGLSASPVVGGVISSLLGLAAGVVTSYRVLRAGGGSDSAKPQPTVDVRPLALLVLGIALAAPLGILARTHRIFEPRAAPSSEGATLEVPARLQGVLFAAEENELERLLGLAHSGNKAALLAELRKSRLPVADRILSGYSNDLNGITVVLELLQTHQLSLRDSALLPNAK